MKKIVNNKNKKKQKIKFKFVLVVQENFKIVNKVNA